MKTIRIPVIPGDGTGEDIWGASREIFEEAVLRSSGSACRIEWIPVIAGLKALEHKDHVLPAETVDAITECAIALKGPLTTPVGGGFRSVNVYLRQMFDLYVTQQWPMGAVTETLGVNRAQVYMAKMRVGRLLKHEVERLSTRAQ